MEEMSLDEVMLVPWGLGGGRLPSRGGRSLTGAAGVGSPSLVTEAEAQISAVLSFERNGCR